MNPILKQFKSLFPFIPNYNDSEAGSNPIEYELHCLALNLIYVSKTLVDAGLKETALAYLQGTKSILDNDTDDPEWNVQKKIWSMVTTALIHGCKGNTPEAIQILQDTYSYAEKNLAEWHPIIASVLYWLAYIYKIAGNKKLAMEAAKKSEYMLRGSIQKHHSGFNKHSIKAFMRNEADDLILELCA